jgi:hypothetical protein
MAKERKLNMKRLGISVYPHQSTLSRDKDYIRTAKKYGFSRLFTCLLSVADHWTILKQRFINTVQFAREQEMEVTVDLSPRTLDRLGFSNPDLSTLAEWGITGVRFDQSFSAQQIACFTHNPYGLKIEVNMSHGPQVLASLLEAKPQKHQLVGCHNFYPHRYSGLSLPFFVTCSQPFKEVGLRTAAFVHSSAASFGPWPIMDGLCTLEMHRQLPLPLQVKHLYATGLIDDVIIANAYPSEDELRTMSQINREAIPFTVKLHEDISAIERQIILNEPHFYRGDVSDYFIRSTQSRVKYRHVSIPPMHTPPIKRGDILIDNDLYGQYKGELQIARQAMKNSGRTNVVGHIVPEEHFLIDELKPWSPFVLQTEE